MIARLFAAQRAAFARERYPSLAVRRDRLGRLASLVLFASSSSTSVVPSMNCRNCGNVTNRSSFMSITMLPMIDPATPLQTHTSLETRPPVQAQTALERTRDCVDISVPV